MKAGGYRPGGYRRKTHICSTGPAWIQRASSSSNLWNAIAYGNGIFVSGGGNAAGAQPAITQTSSDLGVTWVGGGSPPVFVGGGPIKPNDLAFGNGVFVAFGDGAGGATSTDGVSWPTFSLGGGKDYLYFGGTVFVVIAVNDNIVQVSSAGGSGWSSKHLPGFPATDTWSVGTYEPVSGTHVVLANVNTARSTDGGVSWGVGGALSALFIGPLVAAAGGGIIVATSNATAQRVTFSVDGGANWSLSNLLPFNTIWDSVIYAQGAFLAASVDGHTAISTDGNNWISGPPLPNPTPALIWSLAYAPIGHYAGVAIISGGTNVAATGTC